MKNVYVLYRYMYESVEFYRFVLRIHYLYLLGRDRNVYMCAAGA